MKPTKSTPATGPTPRFFRTAAGWRRWLERYHASEPELHVGLYKTRAAHKGLVYRQALDEALCWGWIDGVTRSIDDERWMIRFTPRRKNSYWSARNVARARQLIAEGRMAPPGQAAFDARDRSTSPGYSFENQAPALTEDERRLIERNAVARAFWEASPPSYRKIATYWVTSAKRPETRARRLQTLIEDAANGLRIKLVRPAPRPERQATGSGRTKP